MVKIKDMNAPLAIAMWDYSWLLRHYIGGGFENWDAVLDGLAERGYNAVRIDAFPHLIAKDPGGTDVERFRCLSGPHFGFAYWGNPWTVDIEPKKGLVEFLAKCSRRNIRVGLSTWFTKPVPSRNDRVEGPEGIFRAWDETLRFLSENADMGNLVYVDICNEYPQFHGWDWLTKKLDAMAEPTEPGKTYNHKQTELYRNTVYQVLDRLRDDWPEIDFLASQTHNYWEDERDMDYSHFSMLDVHLWMVLNNRFSQGTGYFENIHSTQSGGSDHEWSETYEKMRERWDASKDECIRWMEDKIRRTAEVAKKWDIPVGNTEGWGPIVWADHPSLDWGWVKEAGEISARLALKHGYQFVCTSNFCHPHFPGMWGDIAWHRRMTDRIRSERGPV